MCVCRPCLSVCHTSLATVTAEWPRARAGEKAAATVRGKANAEKDKCKEKLKPSQIDFFASDHSEISVQIIIDKVVMYCSVDGDTKGDKSPFSLAAFNEARSSEDMMKMHLPCTTHLPRIYHAPTMHLPRI